MSHLFIFGFGYSAGVLAQDLAATGWHVSATARSPEGVSKIRALGFTAMHFDGLHADDGIASNLTGATHVLISVPPDAKGDPVLRHHGRDIESAVVPWLGYLSTVGVYGDRQGGWVDETTPPTPGNERSRRRLQCETAWQRFASGSRQKLHIFRLAGIYGPGRSPIDKLRSGRARRVVKPGQVFNRIHVSDIAAVLKAAIQGRGTEQIYNVADDEPAQPEDVVAFAADLLGIAPPPAIPFHRAGLSDIALSFYSENKRVRNTRIKNDLGIVLKYPTYREGLTAIVQAKQ